jgi:hypothetical protein
MQLLDTLLGKAEDTIANFPDGNIFSGSSLAAQSLASGRQASLHPQTQTPLVKTKHTK